MIIKAVSLFLIAMLVLGMFGKLRMPKIGPKSGKSARIKNAQKCKHCGGYVLGEGPCPCRDQT